MLNAKILFFGTLFKFFVSIWASLIIVITLSPLNHVTSQALSREKDTQKSVLFFFFFLLVSLITSFTSCLTVTTVSLSVAFNTCDVNVTIIVSKQEKKTKGAAIFYQRHLYCLLSLLFLFHAVCYQCSLLQLLLSIYSFNTLLEWESFIERESNILLFLCE